MKGNLHQCCLDGLGRGRDFCGSWKCSPLGQACGLSSPLGSWGELPLLSLCHPEGLGLLLCPSQPPLPTRPPSHSPTAAPSPLSQLSHEEVMSATSGRPASAADSDSSLFLPVPYASLELCAGRMNSPWEALWELAFLLEGSCRVLGRGGCAGGCLEDAEWGGGGIARQGGGGRAWLSGELSSPVNVGPKRASHWSRITQQFGARPGLQPRCVSPGGFALQLFWGDLERVWGEGGVSAAPRRPGRQHTQWVVLPSLGRRVQGWQSPGWGRSVFASLMLTPCGPPGERLSHH